MCSFLVATLLALDFQTLNYRQQFRGPDHTEAVVVFERFVFIHNLLHLTGAFTPQPFVDEAGGVAATFNGEIYNYLELVPTAQSDGEVLLPLYRQYGWKFVRQLDGEFAMVLIDRRANVAVLATDVFGTKPLHWKFEGGNFFAASYESAIPGDSGRGTTMLEPNTVLVVCLATGEEITRSSVFEFDLRQFKSHTTDWESAFLTAVQKRVQYLRFPPFIGLSSGFDSGAIQSALLRLAVPHVSYTIFAQEDQDVVARRIARAQEFGEAYVVRLSFAEFEREFHRLAADGENFQYKHPGRAGPMVNDPAACGVSFVARHAREHGNLVYLSGSGADETISDYGFNRTRIYKHSDFGGYFPGNLSEIFPWYSFFLGTQRDYLMKEELVAGLHGQEARYPFLDKRVVQEYLWLKPDVKNSAYKGVLRKFLLDTGYPVAEGKRGFDAADNLLWDREESEIVQFPRRAKTPTPSPAGAHMHMHLWRYLDVKRMQGTAERRESRTDSRVLTVLTCVNDEAATALDFPLFKIFAATASGVFPVANVCAGAEWAGMSTRLKRYAEFLDTTQDPDKIVLVADGLDVFFNEGSKDGVERLVRKIEEMTKHGKRVIMSTEPFCGWGGAKECNEEEMGRFDPVAFGENRFLNAGVYVGTAANLLWLIQGVIAQSEQTDFRSDQRLFMEFYWKNKQNIALDTKQELFGNFITLVNEPCPDRWKPPCGFQTCCVLTDNIFAMPAIVRDYQFTGCSVTRQHVKPILWHGNGMGKQIFFYALHKLSESCPTVADAIGNSNLEPTLRSILDGIAATAHIQERTESWKQAQSQMHIA